VLCRNVGSYQLSLHIIPEERRELENKISNLVVTSYCDNKMIPADLSLLLHISVDISAI